MPGSSCQNKILKRYAPAITLSFSNPPNSALLYVRQMVVPAFIVLYVMQI